MGRCVAPMGRGFWMGLVPCGSGYRGSVQWGSREGDDKDSDLCMWVGWYLGWLGPQGPQKPRWSLPLSWQTGWFLYLARSQIHLVSQGQDLSLLGPLDWSLSIQPGQAPCKLPRMKGFRPKPWAPKEVSYPSRPCRERVCIASSALGTLTQTLGVLAVLVAVPVALNNGMSLLVLALCLCLVWFL